MRRKVCERVSTHEACGRTDGIKRSRNKGLLAIALFKWFKSALLLLLSFGFLKLLHRDLGEVAEGVANNLRVDSDNRYLGALLAKLSLLDDKKLAALSALTFAYCALFVTEGTGLFFEKRWAEYLTIGVTASLLPLEIVAVYNRLTLVRVLTLVVNSLVIGYLVWELRARMRAGR